MVKVRMDRRKKTKRDMVEGVTKQSKQIGANTRFHYCLFLIKFFVMIINNYLISFFNIILMGWSTVFCDFSIHSSSFFHSFLTPLLS
jgi:hypothetical protein